MFRINKEDVELELLLLAIFRLSGYDFRQYMKSSIMRRVQNRLSLERLSSITSLTEKIIHDEAYLNKILSDFSINVTEMFRDPAFFKAFRNEVVALLKDLPEIRIWHAGCSTGEEVYSMAILMEEEGLGSKTKIYATDMNENVLAKAERGIIPLQKMQLYTKNYLLAGGKKSFSEYYTADCEAAYLNPDLLKHVVFAQHNLVTDRSFNEFHVIVCRNVLIYFNVDLQARVFHLFNESLSPGGFLGLGSKESIRTDIKSFEDFNPIEKIFRKKNRK
ncbi:protein-glutamate O-methyltransferase CheR [Bacillus sp. S/N-304-OC-R1]|uniref:CheR family methyltransferase n=1 Tax=Bacillus sp. S/N-304-OC-R1 TaxID=2758034 RepID=UPI001C8DDDA9|nr:protein-glutamate O-methyltransferase CheR [Bacillus sp. S/N-304-OC-R1]MBY0122059.1 protein-glutamate O-methyltransferase CheR [Bacillus sp. S/N-304-OC-R1]